MRTQRYYRYYIICSAAIVLMGFVVYAVIDQTILADALVDACIE